MLVNKQLVIPCLGIFMLISYGMFLKGFFPMKRGIIANGTDENNVPPIPGTSDMSIPPGKHDRMIILVIDAMREDFVFSSQYQMPFLNQLMNNKHALGFKATAHPPTVTLPRIKALTTGGIPGFVDVILNFGSSALEEDNLISRLHHADKHLVFYGDDTWIKLFPNHFLRTDGTTSFFVADYTEVDTNVTRHLPDELTRYDWDGMILHYLGLDHIGHLAGPTSPLVPPKLMEMDAVVHKIYKAMEQWLQDAGQRSVLMLCGDHGMSDQGGHGGASPGETTVPVIFASPNYVYDTDSSFPDSIMQVDVAPTLAAMMGVSIPRNNLGEIVEQALIGYGLQDRLRLVQINAHQVAVLLEHNIPNIEKERGYWLYKETEQRHTDWLKGTNLSVDEHNVYGKHILKDYGKSVREMRQRVVDTSSDYDLHLMGVTIALLWLVLFSILAMAVSPEIRLTGGRVTLSLIFCIPAVLCHVTLCTGSAASNFLCSTNVMVILVQLAVIFVVVMATLFSVMVMYRYNPERHKELCRDNTERMLIGGVVLHTLSLLSSSFVEEEHQTWYFLTTSVHILILVRLTLLLVTRYHPHQPNTNVDQENLYKQLSAAQQRRKTDNNSNLPHTLTLVKAAIAVCSVLILCRLLRRWNQTGDKWLTVPDIGDWLVRPENKSFLSISSLISMVTLTVTRWNSKAIGQSLLVLVSMATVYCYQAATGVVFFQAVYSGTSKGLMETRTTYILVFLHMAMSIWQAWNQSEALYPQSTSVWSHIQSSWLMLMMLVLRPHNSALVAMTAVTEHLVSSHLVGVLHLRPAILTIYCYWMGQAFFFFQGNSNSLTSVDVAAGYIGLDDYQPVLIGLLMFVSTYAGPVFWMISLFKYLHHVDVYGGKHSLLQLSHDHQMAALTLLTCSCLPLAVYTALVTAQRYHLFVWTVFSPKLLYEGCLSVVTVVFAITHIVWSYSYETERKRKERRDR